MGVTLDYFEQLERLADEQGGYFYPWRSALGSGNGEDAYTVLVEAHLAPDKVVLDAGCGHGSDMLAFASKVARFIGYDAVAPFVAIARRRAKAAGLANVELIVANSSGRYNDGAARMPVEAESLNLVVSRRGPTNWIAAPSTSVSAASCGRPSCYELSDERRSALSKIANAPILERMATRNVSLTDNLDQFVQESVRSGEYQNASEVIRTALRLMKSAAEARAAKLERLRAAIQIGLDDVERGDVIEVEWDDLDDWLDGLGRPSPK